ncbi:hypothetical protein ACFT79_09375 [[Kitasatospora] papulosa]|uniref:hypothetical protein n=1 Tax=[Kitasatospora] papulosa TaxID=1464011 RepID=UPI00363FB886
MATVSAIPSNLHKYSAACTKAEEDLLTWIYTVLKPAIGAYQSKGGPGVAASFDEDLMREVAAARSTDHSVKLVGIAFLQADSWGGTLPTPLEALYDYVFGASEESRLNAATKPLKVDEKELVASLLHVQRGQAAIGEPGDKWMSLAVQKLANEKLGVPPDWSWEFTLSLELWGAYNLPFPSVDPDGTRFSRRENAVLSWLELHRETILKEAKARNISPQAIAAAIAWEALENPSPTMAPIGATWSGPGKVHFVDHNTVVLEVEQKTWLKGNRLPAQTEEQRAKILATPEGSIRYIAAIMEGYANVTDQSPCYKSIRYDVGMLTQLYQGGKGLKAWHARLQEKQKEGDMSLKPENPMPVWAAASKRFLDLAMPVKPQ